MKYPRHDRARSRISNNSACSERLKRTLTLEMFVMTKTTQSMLAEVRKLAPDIMSRVAEIEALGQLPSDLVEALRAIGIFRMLVPRGHGGLELDLPSALEIIRALAKSTVLSAGMR